MNRIVVGRRPLLLLVSAESILPILEPARDVQHLPDRLVQLVEARLNRLNVPTGLVRAEIAAMEPVLVARTASRSVLGIQNDFARLLPSYLPEDEWSPIDLAVADERLAETPCFGKRQFEDVVFPSRKTIELLWRRWAPDAAAPRVN